MSADDSLANDSSAPVPADRRVLRVPILLALVASAGAALLVQPQVVASVRDGEIGAAWLWIAPGAFAVVVALAALDVWRAWRAGRAGNFGWLVVAIAFIGVLAPQTWSEYRTRTSAPASSMQHYDKMAKSNDARVRSLVMEAAGYSPRSDGEVGPLLLRGLNDGDPLVRESARAAVAHRAQSPDLRLEDARVRARAWAP